MNLESLKKGLFQVLGIQYWCEKCDSPMNMVEFVDTNRLMYTEQHGTGWYCPKCWDEPPKALIGLSHISYW